MLPGTTRQGLQYESMRSCRPDHLYARAITTASKKPSSWHPASHNRHTQSVGSQDPLLLPPRACSWKPQGHSASTAVQPAFLARGGVLGRCAAGFMRPAAADWRHLIYPLQGMHVSGDHIVVLEQSLCAMFADRPCLLAAPAAFLHAWLLQRLSVQV